MARPSLRGLWKAARILARVTALLLILAGIAWVGVNSDWHPLAVGPVAVVTALPIWQLAHPGSYRRLITGPSLRRRKRRWYRQTFDNVMEACELRRSSRQASTSHGFGTWSSGCTPTACTS